ncbi:MAG: sigma-54 dependent transcriptional regulator [Dehalococcoidia bacterium]|nr:sigma-54 dependent transcriptional regulator [Dehalococcoidia bacterium]
MSAKGSILIIDDEQEIRESLEQILGVEGYRLASAATAEEGLKKMDEGVFDLVLLDINLPDRNGLELLKILRRDSPDAGVIMITAYDSSQMAFQASKEGAESYITKPWDNDKLLLEIRNALDKSRLQVENVQLRRALKRYGLPNIIGKGERIQRVLDLITQVAPSRATILIAGESGTGKELVAKTIHATSPRADRPFVPINTGSMPVDLLESTLFGHVKGAFTSAIATKRGLFEVADQGTIFFDEIGTIGVETQAKLLRVIQEREFMRLGGVETIKVDVRIIAATNVDLRRMMEEGRFREDLYYRLHVITVQLPPLRDRKDDIPLLVQHFLDKYGRENNKTDLELSPEALDLLQDYDWPGNVRELENVIERAVVLSPGSRIEADFVPDHVRRTRAFELPQFVLPPEGISFKEVITDFEKRLIESTLETAGGVQKRAAELLQIKPTTLNEMIKRYDIRPRRKKAANGSGAAATDDASALEPIVSEPD